MQRVPYKGLNALSLAVFGHQGKVWIFIGLINFASATYIKASQ